MVRATNNLAELKNNSSSTEAKTMVYYFSGTGNSYHVAKTISESLGGILKPIGSLKMSDTINTDLLCFVFPIYDFKPPKRVTEIVENLSQIKANYIVAIGTYGVSLSSAMYHFKETLKNKNVVLSQGYGVKLPHNAVCSLGFTEEENSKRIMNADKKIALIISSIHERAAGKIEKTPLLEDLTLLKQFPNLMRFLYILIVKGPKTLSFTVTNDCVGCFQCQKICPVNNISIVEGKPNFGKNCTGCFACLQWCPKTAINIGKYSFEEIFIQQYHHPKVKASDLIMDKNKYLL